jgi:hypothetical protein
MCLACEQDAIWLAYLDSQGLLKEDDPAAVEELFAAFPVQPLPAKREWDAPTPEAPDEAAVRSALTKPAAPKSATATPAANNQFSCDDPTAE